MNAAVLEAAWVRQLLASWAALNYSHFDERMRPPSMRLSESETQLGLWQPELRTIALSRKLCAEQPWGRVIEVLKHEMAHQYVHEVMGVYDESAHGPAFRQLCARLAIDPQAVGAARDGGEHETSERARLLQRVTKLLALAESQNRHEAEAAMSAAQKLMLKHNLQAVTMRQGYGFLHLGAIRSRILEPQRRIGHLLGEHFFVEAIWVASFDAKTGASGTVLEVCGTPENLAMAEYVHGFLSHTAERLWREHKRSTGLKKDRERLAFMAGVIQGFEDTLAQKAKAHQEEGLVWRGDADLTRFYRARHPRIRHVRHTGASGDARQHGRAAGRNVILHKPIHESAAAGSRKLLGS